VDGAKLRSKVTGRAYAIGKLETPSVAELRSRVRAVGNRIPGDLKVSTITGEARSLHSVDAYAGALFQVASQFNLLEMTAPHVTPDDGVTRYQYDRTQGPACAIACGAATIYRNYFAPVSGGVGQTRGRQIDCLGDLGARLGSDGERLWAMRNGYALCTATGLDGIGRRIGGMGDDERDQLRGTLRVGIQWDAQVTDLQEPRLVSQVFCAALPVAYTAIPAARWEPFARLVLEATYEATICAAALNAARDASNIALLTYVGGGAFGNESKWIEDAIGRSLGLARGFDLDVRLVKFG